MIVTCVLGTAKQPTPLDRLVDIAVYDPVHHFGGRDVIHYHQAIAVVVADSFETARAAANLLIVNYEVDGSASFDLSAHAGAGEFEPRVAVGDFEAAFRDAPVKLDKTYTTPAESHAMMEPRATLASWDDDRITLWTSNQMITWSAQSIAKAFSIPPEMSGWTLPISAVALARKFSFEPMRSWPGLPHASWAARSRCRRRLSWIAGTHVRSTRDAEARRLRRCRKRYDRHWYGFVYDHGADCRPAWGLSRKSSGEPERVWIERSKG